SSEAACELQAIQFAIRRSDAEVPVCYWPWQFSFLSFCARIPLRFLVQNLLLTIAVSAPVESALPAISAAAAMHAGHIVPCLLRPRGPLRPWLLTQIESAFAARTAASLRSGRGCGFPTRIRSAERPSPYSRGIACSRTSRE